MDKKNSELTTKQRKFVESYSGDIKEAAGLSGLSYDYCRRLVTKRHILSAIRDRERENLAPCIASREDRQEFWTNVMNDQEENMRDRLRASELLGRSNADFTDKLEHSGQVDIATKIREGRARLE